MTTKVSKCFDISLDSEVTAARGSSQVGFSGVQRQLGLCNSMGLYGFIGMYL